MVSDYLINYNKAQLTPYAVNGGQYTELNVPQKFSPGSTFTGLYGHVPGITLTDDRRPAGREEAQRANMAAYVRDVLEKNPSANVYYGSPVGSNLRSEQGGAFFNRLTPEMVQGLSNYQLGRLLSYSGTPQQIGLDPSVYGGSEKGFSTKDIGSYFVKTNASGVPTGAITENQFSQQQLKGVLNREFAADKARNAKRGNFGGFGKFLPFAFPLLVGGGLALSAGAAAGGAAGAGTAAGAAGAGTTGLAAGGAASSGLGSLASNFAVDAALKGALTGGVGGFLSGGDLSSALKGATLGGLTGGYGQALGSSLGFSGAGLKGFTGALQGASGGLAQGNLKDAGLGAILGGAGSYITAGGNVPGLGRAAETINWNQGGSRVLNPGTGILGKLTSLTGASTGGQPMKLGSLLQAGGDIYGYMQGKNDIDEMRKLLEAQAGRAEAQFRPYSQAGQQALANMQAPSLEALQNDPGYQFRLQQGQQALERSLAARGLGQSGAALKAAQEYGQGLADQTYNDFFNRQGQLADLGYGAASGLGSLYENLGNVQAAAELERMNSRNNLISSLTGNQGLIRGLGGLFGYA